MAKSIEKAYFSRHCEALALPADRQRRSNLLALKMFLNVVFKVLPF